MSPRKTLTLLAFFLAVSISLANVFPLLVTTDVPVSPGFNLVSLPSAPVDTAIPNVLSSINGNYDVVFAYDAVTDQWKSYDPERPDFLNSLSDIDQNTGFWINMLSDDLISVTGDSPVYTTYDLKQGWNLISFPSVDTVAVDQALANVAGSYTDIMTYETNPGWKFYNPSVQGVVQENIIQNLEPGNGYWVDVPSDVRWYFAEGKYYLNLAPIITSNPPTTANLNAQYSYQSQAFGSPTITWGLSQSPSGMTIDPSSGLISWTPVSGQEGPNSVTVQATNSFGSDSQPYTINVGGGAAPTIISTPVTAATVGQAYSYDVDATGSGTITYSFSQSPTGMTINSGTGLVSWTPASGQVGPNSVTLVATNSYGSDNQPYTITVSGVPPSFTSTPVTTATVNQQYVYDANAAGTGTITYSLAPTPAPPASMTINANTGVIIWTPVFGDEGLHSIKVIAANSYGSAEQPFTITVNGLAPDITSTAVTTATVNSAYSYDVDATGSATITFSLSVKPTGMTINANTGLISWTPSFGQEGPQSVTVVATNSYGTDSQSYTVTVNGLAPDITSTAVTTATVNSAYSYDVDATGSTTITYSLSVKPVGMTINSANGVISWTPTFGQEGPHSVTVVATNSYGSDSQSYIVNVNGLAPDITTSAVTTATVTQAYSYDVNADGSATITYSLSVKPTGMTINSASGLISWTPSFGQEGPHSVTVVATNSYGSDSQPYTVTVNGLAPTITTTSPLPSATIGTAYSQQLGATGSATISWTKTSGPAWMSVSSAGLITGTPQCADSGSQSITVQASNSYGSDSDPLSITVNGVCPTITTASLPNGEIGQAYSQQLAASGSTPMTWTKVSGAAWISVSTGGLVTGTPACSDSGSNSLTVRAENVYGQDIDSLTITVNGQCPSVTTPSPLPSATIASAYSQQLTASGTTPITWSKVSGPAWMSVSSGGLITGTPQCSDSGSSSITVQATNTYNSDSKALSITVNGVCPTISTTTLPDGSVGSAYSQTLSASGSTPITWTKVSGPSSWISVSSTGSVTGTPQCSDSGPNSFSVIAENAYGSDTDSLSITVNGVCPDITSTPVTTGTVNSAYTYDVDATGSATITFSLSVKPTGMTIDSGTGVISWTPSYGQEGNNDVTVVATNTYGSDSQSYTINVAGLPPTIDNIPDHTAIVGQSYSRQASSPSGSSPKTWSLTVSPTGMTIDSNGLISWPSPVLGNHPVTVRVSNSWGFAEDSYNLNTGSPPSITTISDHNQITGQAYSHQASASGTSPITWSLTVAPAGMTISATGLIEWPSPTTGDHSVTVRTENTWGSDTEDYVLHVGVPPTINDIPDQTSIVNQADDYQATTSAGTSPTFSKVSGPAWITVPSNGLISWTAPAEGDSVVTVRASNDWGTSDDSFTIHAGIAPVITSSPVTTAQVLQAYSYDVNAGTGTSPITFSLVTFPASMTIDSGTGVISWTPAKGQEGSQSVTVRATNDWGQNDQSYTITVTGIIESCADDPGVAGATYKITADISATGTCLVVGANGITIDGGYGSGLKRIVDGTGTGRGIDLNGKSNLEIKNIEIKEFEYGIVSFGGSNNININNNNIHHNTNTGLAWVSSNSFTVSNNNIHHNDGFGITGTGTNNLLNDNIIQTNGDTGLQMGNMDDSTVRDNSFTSNNNYGIQLSSISTGNSIYHNNFLFNVIQAIDSGSGNNWDNGYPSGGNYWNNYDTPAEGCNDVFSGVNQDQAGSDGFCDVEYSANGVVDDYPFTAGV